MILRRLGTVFPSLLLLLFILFRFVPLHAFSAKMHKGIIFDVDGTLADSWKLGFDATQLILKRHDIPLITPEIYHECTRYATPDRLARHAGLQPGDDEYLKVGKQLAQEFDALYIGLVSKDTAAFFPGIEQLLHSIPETIAVGALTNAAEQYAHAVLRTNCPVTSRLSTSPSIYSRFQSIRGADTVPRPKPAPDGLLLVCRELNVPAHQCVYVGDSPSDGVSAHAAGMKAIGVLWGSHTAESLRQAPFDHLCSSVEDLHAILVEHCK
jgi:phosphoglycolate phosphatase-like HAD superfamily hydrolase